VEKRYSFTVHDVPNSLLVCSMSKNGEMNYTIEEMSPEHVVLRMAKDSPDDIREMYFHSFEFEANGYRCYGPFTGKKTKCTIRRFDKAVICEIDSKIYSDMVDSFCRQYQHYIRIKSQSNDNSFSKELAGYPYEKDEMFANSYNEWISETNVRHKIDEAITRILEKHSTLELALEIDNRKEYERFLSNGVSDARIKRIYIGNAYCNKLFPERMNLEKMLKKAEAIGLKYTIVMPLMADGKLEQEKKCIDAVFEICKSINAIPEIEVNDWGMLKLLKDRTEAGENCNIIFGRLLNKRRKDPRYEYKWGWENLEEKKDNSLNDETYTNLLKDNGIVRYELECCGYEINIPKGKSSIHMPFYQTNTSQYCPLYSLCKYGDRGHQNQALDCPGYCEKYTLMYPTHLSMVGKYNSIFAIDSWTLENPEVLDKYIRDGVDRLVINL